MPLLPKVSLFSLFGIANGLCFGLSYMMTPEDYVYYFGYKGNGRYSDMIRSQFGSNTLANAVWTVPSLFLVGAYMHSKLGALTMAKFTPLCFLSVCAF